MSFGEALRDALEVPDPHASQERVQETVAKRLEGLAPGTDARRTGYFNHSWAPDLVLRGGDSPERQVFLRFDVREPSFEDDLRYLANEKPLFLDLLAANPVETQSREEERLDVAAALRDGDRTEVLVTEVPAVDRFENSVEKDRDVRTATQHIVLGGRGLVDSSAADHIVSSWSSAAQAASRAQSRPLRESLDQVETYLSRISSIDLETALRSRWVAAGQPAETFPGREDWRLDDRPPWEIAWLVLGLVDQEAPIERERWQDVASAVSASALGHELFRIGRAREGGKVDDLIRAGLPLWTAQYAYVPPLAADSFDPFHWSFGSYSLAINLVRRRAFFTDIATKWNRVPRTDVLPEARARQELLTDPAVLGVGLITTEENVRVDLRPTATETLGRRLQQYVGEGEEPAWRTARIRSLVLRVPGSGAEAHADFERSVVRTTEPVPLRTFVLLVARFVAALSSDELTRLEEYLKAS